MKSRKTKQKELLEQEIKKIKGFFTAEDLFNFESIKKSGIGIATIYRFLKDKKNKRELHSYICENKCIYSTSSSNHCHYVCQVCGKKEHINIKDIGIIKKNIKGTICHFQIDVTGICEKCIKKKH
ncbi:MAG: transcriptional repressor [Candidatus Woesearchaeota archaeon]